MDDDYVFGVFALVAIVGGIWWFTDNYEIVDRAEQDELVEKYLAPPARPTGELPAGLTNSGSKWFVDSDSVRGPRDNRMVWVKSDHSEDKTVSHRETMTLYQINCNDGGYFTKTVINYSDKGESLRSWHERDFGDSRSYAAPKTMMARVFTRACHTGFDTPIE